MYIFSYYHCVNVKKSGKQLWKIGSRDSFKTSNTIYKLPTIHQYTEIVYYILLSYTIYNIINYYYDADVVQNVRILYAS